MNNVFETEKSNVGKSADNRYYVVITWSEVYVVTGSQELFNVLYYRIGAECEVFVLQTLEEANVLACQRWPFRFYSNPFLLGHLPMPLPSSGTYKQKDEVLERELMENARSHNSPLSFGVQQTAMQGLPVPQVSTVPMGEIQGIFWSIDAMNMYASAPDLNALVYCMDDPRWIYPHAQSWLDCNMAITKAREAYLARFYRRYASLRECPSLPEHEMGMGDSYEDGFYAEREKSRIADPVLDRLVSYGLL